MTASLRLVSSNRVGQQLGARGLRTRRRLLDAAAQLLGATSPIDLNAAAIARAAGTSPATFYLYFDDVRELVLALVPDVAPDAAAMFPRPDAFRVPGRLADDAEVLVAAVFAAWDRNAPVLLFRNLEADRGDAAFEAARYAWAEPVLERLIDALVAARGWSRARAYADAVVLLAAVERVAATSHRAPTHGPPAADLRAALVRTICRAFDPHGD